MTSEPILTGHPVLRFARQLTDAAGPGGSLPRLVDEPRRAARGAAGAGAGRGAAGSALRLRVLAEAERSGAGAERGAPLGGGLGGDRDPRRPGSVPARTSSSPAPSMTSHCWLQDWTAARSTSPRHARSPPPSTGCRPAVSSRSVPSNAHRAEQHLVALAAHHDAKALAVLGRRLFEVIAPDLAEAFEGKVLADQEAAAARRVMFTMREDDAGTCHGRFRIPTLHGQWLRKMLLALCSPVRSTPTDIDEPLPTEVRHGHAFCQLIEAVPATSLPKAGGCGATIVVTMRLDQLLADLHEAGVCDLDTGGQITAAQARRLACTAGIIPAVLGGTLRSPRPRQKPPRLHGPPTHRHGHPRQDLHRRELRPTTLHVPRPPRHTLVARAAAPTSRPAGSSAATTTDASTTPPTATSTSPTAKSASTEGREGRQRRGLDQVSSRVRDERTVRADAGIELDELVVRTARR